jgi:hypothetical protein
VHNEYTPARLYTIVVGATLVAVGLLGFIASSSFSTGYRHSGEFILFQVNGWHNIVHLASGAVGLMLLRRPDGPRLFALGFGAVYLVVTIWGFAIGAGHSILSIIPVNTADNILHLAISLAGIGAGVATRTGNEAAAVATAR